MLGVGGKEVMCQQASNRDNSALGRHEPAGQVPVPVFWRTVAELPEAWVLPQRWPITRDDKVRAGGLTSTQNPKLQSSLNHSADYSWRGVLSAICQGEQESTAQGESWPAACFWLPPLSHALISDCPQGWWTPP